MARDVRWLRCGCHSLRDFARALAWLVAWRLHQRSLSRRRPGQEDPLLLVHRGAQDARSGRRLHDGRACRHRQCLRHPARIPLSAAALRADPGPRRGCAQAGDAAERPPSYRFKLRRGVAVPRRPLLCAGPAGPPDTREVVAADVAFQFARLADPAVNSPVASTFADVLGFAAFGKRLVRAAQGRSRRSRRCRCTSNTSARAASRASWCAATGSWRSCWRAPIRRSSTGSPCPSPRPWPGRPWPTTTARRGAPTSPTARWAPGRSGWRSTRSSTASCSSATRPGTAHAQAERRGAGHHLPDRDRPGRTSRPAHRSGLCRPAPAVPRRIRFTREKREHPALQQVPAGLLRRRRHHQGELRCRHRQGRPLSPEMEARGMRLDKEVEPTVFYIGFNMEDPVGRRAGRRQGPQAAPGHEPRHRCRGLPAPVPQRPRRAGAVAAAAGHLRLRQGLPKPVPPARPEARARALLAEAGYKNGIDPATGQPLKLTSTPATPPRRRCCSTSSSSRPGARSASTCRSRPPPTTSSRTRCAGAPTRSSTGAGSPISPTRRTSSSCSSAETPTPRAKGRTRPTSATRSSTASTAT